MRPLPPRVTSLLALLALGLPAGAAVFNLKVVTDASPDYADLPAMIRSITGRWETPEEKCWALFYWNHRARRQTQPVELHRMALTDPIRQFNDYGYTMCSTIAGINCALWNALGLQTKYWDISLHTVSEVEYGGRLYNRAPGSRIEFLHAFDGGQTWTLSYALTNTAPPWDVIHYETVESIPPGTRSALVKYRLQSPAAGTDACSLYAVRLEANHRPADTTFQPLEITFHWSERQADYSLVERSHTEVVPTLPHRYTIHVGGADHPVVNSLRVGARDSRAPAKPGYSDGRDVGGEKFVPRWVTYGKNLARGKPYTLSVPSTSQWGAGDPDGKKLTDGVAGPPYAGGRAPSFAACWNKGQTPEIAVDLGRGESCGAFRIQLGAGWPWWDALQGEVKDQVQVLTSRDGQDFRTQGFFNLNLRWKDLPANHFWPDEEALRAHLFELIPPAPVEARRVRFKITPARTVTASEVEVLDGIRYAPFDLRLALPDERLVTR